MIGLIVKLWVFIVIIAVAALVVLNLTGVFKPGTISFRKPDADSRTIVRRLQDAGIIAAPRQGWVRTSPHFYISPKDIERLIQELP